MATDTETSLDALTPDPHNVRHHDARNLALIADAPLLRCRRPPLGALTGTTAERIPGAEIVE